MSFVKVEGLFAWRSGPFGVECVFCILLIAARRGDKILLLLSFYSVRMPGWALSGLPALEYTHSIEVFTLFL